jgi:methyltransferase
MFYDSLKHHRMRFSINVLMTRYLRTQLFPMHPDLRHAALLKSMDLPHHLKIDDHLPYREGIALAPSATKVQGTLVDVGLGTVHLPTEQIEPHTRVTIDMSAVPQTPSTGTHITNAKLAESTDPTTEMGYHWGYATRQASSLSAVITESPFAKGYDVVIGTSERGEPVEEIRSSLPPFAHLLVVFGGQAGIEAAASNDPELKKVGGEGIGGLFDWWVNAVPGQGSRTIRTEEAIWIVLGQMFSEFQRKGIK